MARYDQLGPLTRAVINHSPQDLDVEPMIKAFMATRADLLSKHPECMESIAAEFDAKRDENLSRFLLERIRAKYTRWDGPI